MNCRIKKIKTGKKKRLISDIYFDKHLELETNHWAKIDEAKVFDSVADARKTIKDYKLKNVEVEKIKK